MKTKNEALEALDKAVNELEKAVDAFIQVKKQDSWVSVMKFKDAPIGARFRYPNNILGDAVFVKIHANDRGLVVRWNGNIAGFQSHCSWIDETNGYDFDTFIELL